MNLLKKNMELEPALKLSNWRKIALGTWKTAKDPSVYGLMEINAAPALAYIEKVRQETGVKITLTHVLGKAVAQVLEKHPEINCVIRWGRIYPRKNIDVFFQVASDKEGRDLSGMTIRKANLKSVAEIATEMHDRVDSIRSKGDPGYKKMKNNLGRVPGFFIGLVMNVAEFFMYTLNLWSPLLGTPRDSFGSVMVTNVGSLGVDTAFAPLVACSRVPLLIALGTVKPMPVVKEGKIVIEEQMRLCVTFDHRLIDGMVASHMNKTLTKILLNPE